MPPRALDPMAQPGPLETFSTQELINEIARRNHSTIVVMATDVKNRPDKVTFRLAAIGCKDCYEGMLGAAAEKLCP